MLETTEITAILPFRAHLEAARAVRGHAQELPARWRPRATLARPAESYDATFASLNPDEGVLIPAASRPAGVVWRLHPASFSAGPAVARHPRGALA